MNTPAPSPKHTPDQIEAYLTDQHAHYADDPLYNHISHSFEDMADISARAQKDLKSAQKEADWQAREDMPGFAGTYARLDALNLQRVAA